MNHDAEQLLAAYALDALDPAEQAELELHLERCVSCRAILAEYQQVTEGLLLAVSARPPAPRLRDRVVAAVGAAAGRRPRPAWGDRLRRPQAALAALGVLLAALNLYLLAQVVGLSERSETLLAQLRTNQTALAVMSYPNSRVANLEQDSLRGSFVYDDQLPLAVLNVWGLPALAPDQAYQLWLIQQDGSRASGGLLTADDGNAFVSTVVWSPVSFEFIQGIGISIEPAEGSKSPTGPRVLGTDLVHFP